MRDTGNSCVVARSALRTLPSRTINSALAMDTSYRRLWSVLLGEDGSPDFAHLSATDRTAIREILLDTKPAFVAAGRDRK